MKKFQIISLPADFKIVMNSPLKERHLSPLHLERIESIWANERIRTKEKLFNGKIFCVDQLEEKQLCGHFEEYKYYLSQVRDPLLLETLQLHPLCICSYTCAGNLVLIGKRAGHVTEYPHFYELVPAGGLDPSSTHLGQVDIVKQWKTELKEEAGIEEEMILSITPQFLILDAESPNYEICARVELDTCVLNKQAERDEEYTHLYWIPKKELPSFIHDHRAEILPLSLKILEVF
ncbi:MAG: hypothetical protein BGO14_06085 [Chlamydiales bacterium 38-26]|nr:hypothetical protein [Chlamydiales bacterium]OJV08461.1 MAG: hypothetical protein BGO14_06085 [Chlamydiales bacterium 38-26]